MRTAILAAALFVAGAAAAPGAQAAHRRHGAHRGHYMRVAVVIPGESLALDAASGNYRITYHLPGDPFGRGASALRHTVFVPATKIDPAIESDFTYQGDREVHYRYRIGNGRHARQALVSVTFEPVSEISALSLPPTHVAALPAAQIAQLEGIAATALATPPHWDGHVRTSPLGGLRIGWRFNTAPRARGLAPGRVQEGFGMPADDLPGILLARLTGDAPGLQFSGPWPDGDVGDRLAYLTTHDYITRAVAAPTIPVPDPYNAALLLDRITEQSHTWIPLKLLDPFYSLRLDHHLTAAASALRAGDTQGARFDLLAIRTLLAVQQPTLDAKDGLAHCVAPKAAQIDLLAARVLDFDVNYILMRMGEGRTSAGAGGAGAPARGAAQAGFSWPTRP